jgi:chemotaxis protein histidine kinase CheA
MGCRRRTARTAGEYRAQLEAGQDKYPESTMQAAGAASRDCFSSDAVIEQLLRASHSIKGGAGFTGRRNIEKLAHAFEEAIGTIRDGVG